MRGKYCVVTGATGGIGEATARALAVLGATVVAHGRDATKAQAAAARIRQASGNPEVQFAHADLASLAEVRTLGEELVRRLPRLDVLIHNAGLAGGTRALTVDGYESTFAVNHLAPFLLTQALLRKLTATAAARVVIVSSEAHRRAHLDFSDLMMEHGYRPFEAYCRSKLANLLFMRSLARRLEGSAVTVNALHPGIVRTQIFRNAPAPMRVAIATLGRLFTISAEAGARTSIFLASAAELAGRSGGYYIRSRQAEPSAAARDDAAAERLWEMSSRLVGSP